MKLNIALVLTDLFKKCNFLLNPLELTIKLKSSALRNQTLRQWDSFSMPIRAKTKRLQKIFPLLSILACGPGNKICLKIDTFSQK